MKSPLTTIILCTLIAILVGLSTGEMNTAIEAQTEATVVGRVNSTTITQKELDESLISQILPLQQQIYALRRAALDNIILRKILEDEAKKQSVSVEALRERLTAGKVEVLPSQVEEAYAENALAFASMSPDEAKERLRLDLENQARMQNYRAALARLKETSSIEIQLVEPRLPLASILGTAPTTGSKDAVITITEFSDFQCPYCRMSQGVIKQLLQNYQNEVRLVFKHLPLDIHAEAFASARAAFCAGEQSLFWQYHDALFAAETLSAEGLNRIATELGLSLPKFKACLTSETSRSAVLKDKREANQFGINSTPTFVVNGKLVRGAISFEEFKTIIERELKSARHTSRPN
jgi:predicted DsbA family dithiol-disulfide isomerase